MVGIFYLTFVALAVFGSVTDPERVVVLAAMWAQVSPGSLDSTALDAMTLLMLFPAFYFLIIGVLMLYYCQNPEAAQVIAVLAIAVELFAWIPMDIYAYLVNDWAASDVFGLIAFHGLVGVTGVAAIIYRRHEKLVPDQG